MGEQQMEKIKVLMAEDEGDVLDIMASKIETAGYDVIKANDGQEAWDKIQNDIPDVILLDINMPKMNGLEVLKHLRENPSSNRWQPVIIISARRELEDLSQGFSLEADHYLVKPCTINDVLKAIKLMVSLIPHHKPTNGMDEDK